jgi:hypothetical protein
VAGSASCASRAEAVDDGRGEVSAAIALHPRFDHRSAADLAGFSPVEVGDR